MLNVAPVVVASAARLSALDAQNPPQVLRLAFGAPVDPEVKPIATS